MYIEMGIWEHVPSKNEILKILRPGRAKNLIFTSFTLASGVSINSISSSGVLTFSTSLHPKFPLRFLPSPRFNLIYKQLSDPQSKLQSLSTNSLANNPTISPSSKRFQRFQYKLLMLVFRALLYQEYQQCVFEGNLH